MNYEDHQAEKKSQALEYAKQWVYGCESGISLQKEKWEAMTAKHMHEERSKMSVFINRVKEISQDMVQARKQLLDMKKAKQAHERSEKLRKREEKKAAAE